MTELAQQIDAPRGTEDVARLLIHPDVAVLAAIIADIARGQPQVKVARHWKPKCLRLARALFAFQLKAPEHASIGRIG